MIDRRHLLQGTGLAAVAALGGGACARTPDSDASTVRYWGMGAADKDKDEAVKEAFLATDAGRGVDQPDRFITITVSLVTFVAFFGRLPAFRYLRSSSSHHSF